MKNFIFTIILLGVIIYFSGGISTDKLAIKPQKQNNAVSKQTSQVSHKTQPEKRSSAYKPVSSASYSRFNPQPIPQGVILGAREFNFYSSLFSKNGKVVFFMYAPNSTCPLIGQKFYDDLQNFRSRSDVNSYYTFSPVTNKRHNSLIRYTADKLNPGVIDCKTQSECNQKADAINKKMYRFDAISQFITGCIKNVCIINNSKREYVVTNRNIQSTSEALNALKNW